MAGQSYVDKAGASTNAFTVVPMIEKAIDRLSRRASVFGGLGMDSEGRDRLVKTTDIGGESRDITNSSCIQTKEITEGDEVRFTLMEDFKGKPTHGSAPVRAGDYPKMKHDDMRINILHSPEYPFWSEMDQQRFANLIANMEPEYQTQIAAYMAEWNDFLGLQACFHGADRGQLLTTDGGLGIQIGNATSAGQAVSCKNTYVGGSGLIAWNDTRATFEASVGHAIYDLSDTTSKGFSLNAHEKILNQITSNKRFKMVDFMGKQFRAVALADPWLIKRLLSRGMVTGEWLTILRDADIRGPKNGAIDRDQAVIIDKVLYIPCDWMRAVRPYGADNAQPTYGCGLATTYDPKDFIDIVETTSSPTGASMNKCSIIYMGAGALMHGACNKLYGAGTQAPKKNGRVWITPRYGEHGQGGGWAAHTKIGYKRYEPMAEDGRTEFHNDSMLIAHFYDPGPGVAFAS
jgi:hypothetical protein